jgi:hypothetical protein
MLRTTGPANGAAPPDAVSGANRRLAWPLMRANSGPPLAPTPITARGFRRRAVGLTDDEALGVRLFEKTSASRATAALA